MNLQSSILRDGTKVHYLHISEPVEAKPRTFASELINTIREKILSLLVGKSNKTNKHRSPFHSWLIRLLRS